MKIRALWLISILGLTLAACGDDQKSSSLSAQLNLEEELEEEQEKEEIDLAHDQLLLAPHEMIILENSDSAEQADDAYFLR